MILVFRLDAKKVQKRRHGTSAVLYYTCTGDDDDHNGQILI